MQPTKDDTSTLDMVIGMRMDLQNTIGEMKMMNLRIQNLEKTNQEKDEKIRLLKTKVKELEEKKTQFGVFDITSNGDKVVTFDEPFKNMPVVVATASGVNDHATCQIYKQRVTRRNFTIRMIHHNGAWENGRIYWFAVANN